MLTFMIVEHQQEEETHRKILFSQNILFLKLSCMMGFQPSLQRRYEFEMMLLIFIQNLREQLFSLFSFYGKGEGDGVHNHDNRERNF